MHPAAIVLALVLTSGAVAAPASALNLPPIHFVQRVLHNGLQVVMVEDHRTPTVAIFVAYRVGGKNDPPGHSGFAHLFEHLMFKGTANVKPESIDRFTEDNGGFDNAYTDYDITNYFEVVPSNLLQTLIWVEADRMTGLNVDQQNFTTERSVVIGEYNRDVFGDPYGNLDILVDRAYVAHPYRRGVIGSPEQLNSSSLADVLAFHTQFYRPDNAILVISGDVTPARANAWIDSYFGPIVKPAQPIPRITAVEPPQTAERRIAYAKEDVPLSAVRLVYHAAAANSADAAALETLSTILGNGKSSRLYESLVYVEQAASDVSATADLRQQPGLLVLSATAADAKSATRLEPLLDAQVERITTQPVAPSELDKAKTLLLAQLVRERETSDQVGQTISRAAVVEGDVNAVNTLAARIGAVTAADVRRVARTYLNATNRTVITYDSKAPAAR